MTRCAGSIVSAAVGGLGVLLAYGGFAAAVRADCPTEPTYELRVQPTFDLTTSVALGDLDGDGDLDMVSEGILVYLNNGDGTFPDGNGYEPSSRSPVALGDVDGDGDLDIVSSAGGVSVLLNHGDGTFEPAVTYPGGGGGTIALNDLDGDGDLDAAVAGAAGVFVSFNAGDGTFLSPTDYATSQGTHSLAVGDLNGDGDGDIVAVSTASVASVLYNNGDGTFAPHVDLPAGGQAYGVALGDLDGDGRMDIAVAITTTGSVSVLYNLDGDSFSAPVAYPVAGVTLSVAIEDLDADGDADMVATYLDPTGVLGAGAGVLFNHGAGFDPRVLYMGGLIASCVAIGNLDGNGYPDFVVGDSFGAGLFMFFSGDLLALQIGGQPQNVRACQGESVAFSVEASGSDPISFQWRKDGAEIQGATNSTYSIASVSGTDAGLYDVVVTNPCGSVTSDGAELEVAKGVCCFADWNHDGVTSATDVSDFINDWFLDQDAGTLVTDWDHNGVVNSTDVSSFINAWFEDVMGGCG